NRRDNCHQGTAAGRTPARRPASLPSRSRRPGTGASTPSTTAGCWSCGVTTGADYWRTRNMPETKERMTAAEMAHWLSRFTWPDHHKEFLRRPFELTDGGHW